MASFGIIGSAGRMGQALATAIAQKGHDLAGGVDDGESRLKFGGQAYILRA